MAARLQSLSSPEVATPSPPYVRAKREAIRLATQGLVKAPDVVKKIGMNNVITDFFKGQPGLTCLYIFGLLTATILSLVVITRVTTSIYNAISEGNRKKGLWMFMWLAITMVGLIGVNYGVDVTEAHLMPKFDAFTQKQMVDRVLLHNEDEFLGIDPLVYRRMNSTCVKASSTIFHSIVRTFIPNLILIAVLLLFMLTIDVAFVGVFVVAGLVAGGLFAANHKPLHKISTNIERQARDVDMSVFDVFSTLDTVVTRNKTQEERKKLHKQIDGLEKATNCFMITTDRFTYFTYFVVTCAILVCMFLSLRKISPTNNAKSITLIVLAFSLLLVARGKLQNLTGTTTQVVQEKGRYDAVVIPALQDEPRLAIRNASATSPATDVESPRLAELSTATTEKEEVPVIQFHDMSFGYTEHATTSLNKEHHHDNKKEDEPSAMQVEHFSFDVHRGINGLFGPSGVGKSTAGKLLVGLHNEYAGTILVHGRDIREMSKAELRSKVLLSQQSMDFQNLTMKGALLYGNEKTAAEADIQRVWNWIRHVYPGMELDDEEHTIGIAGNHLSTGQLQLLRIANAELSSQPILVLDEPASGIDKAVKKEVLALIEKMGRERQAVLLITHDEETAGLVNASTKVLQSRASV
jgi:ABC-type multidrug transport system fused ATPase/permease subunit